MKVGQRTLLITGKFPSKTTAAARKRLPFGQETRYREDVIQVAKLCSWQGSFLSREKSVCQAGVITGQGSATAWKVLAVVTCTTVAFLAALLVSFIIYLRPLLKELEKLAIICRVAAESMERASSEFETTSKIMNKDLPTTLDVMERAGLEFEELGQNLNQLTGGLVRRNKPASSKKTATSKSSANVSNLAEAAQQAAIIAEEAKLANSSIQEWNAVEALQAGTLASIRRVAQDVSSLTAALAPAMLAWRKRLGFVLDRVDAQPVPPAMTAASPSDVPASAVEGSQMKARTEDINKVESSDEPDSSVALPRLSEENGLNMSTDSPHACPSGRPSSDTSPTKGKSSMETEPSCDGSSTKALELPNLPERPQLPEVDDSFDDKGARFMTNRDEFSHHMRQTEGQAGKEELDSFSNREDQAASDGGLEDQLKSKSPPLSRAAAAEAVLSALANAEKAAMAAAEASGQLEHALQNAERQTGVPTSSWTSMDGLYPF